MSYIFYAPIDHQGAIAWINEEIRYQLAGEVILIQDESQQFAYKRIAFQGNLLDDDPSIPVRQFVLNGPLSMETDDDNIFGFSLTYRFRDEERQSDTLVEDVIWCRLNDFDPANGNLELNSILKEDTPHFIESVALELHVAEVLTELESQPSLPPPGNYYSPAHCNWRLFLTFEGQDALPDRTELIDFQMRGANLVWAHAGGIVSEVVPPGTSAQKIILSNQPQGDGGGNFDPGTLDITLNVDIARQNRFLLAHELGHLFGLSHPDESKSDYIRGHTCSVMVPSRPMSRRNTVGQVETVHLGSERKVTYPHIVSVNSNNNPVILNPSASFTDNPALPFYIPSFYYDDGLPLNTALDLSGALPDPQELTFIQDESDVKWWGWNAGLWNHSAAEPDTIYPDGFSHRHTTPANGDNILHIQLNICAQLADFAPNVFLFKAQLANNQMTISPLNIVVKNGQLSNDLALNLPNRFGQAAFASIPWHIQPGEWAKDMWLVAVAWNHLINTNLLAPLVQTTPLSISATTPMDRFFEIHLFEQNVKPLLRQAVHTFSSLDDFAVWIAQSRCVVVRRPGNPRSVTTPPA